MIAQPAAAADETQHDMPHVFYRDRLGSGVIAVGMSPLVLVLIKAIASPIPTVARFLCGVLAVAVIVVTGRLVRRFGVGISEFGVEVSGSSVRRTIPWTDVVAFRAQPWGPYASIQVELRSGKLIRTPMMQGRKMSWDGGHTRDILTLLDSHLVASRGQRLGQSTTRVFCA
ncbi:MAG TPA: hypothetical protein VIC05_10160 [Solirubrobacteraceae bacterium]|jgi:hypothetical protein